MSRTSLFLLASLCTLLAGTTHAAVSRTYVASYGDDANTVYSCDFAHPCRTFQTAFSQTTTGGEILAVDGSGYGTLVIDRSVAVIANPGIFAGIGVFAGGTGVSIATAGVSVTLRGLTLNGQGGSYGIHMTNGAKLSVENCVIANFSSSGQYGIRVNTAATVRVIDTLVRDNYRGAVFEGGATVNIAGSRFLNNSTLGVMVSTLAASTTTRASISDSVVTGSTYGFYAETASATATARMFVTRSTATNNLYAVLANAFSGGTALLVLSDSMVTDNTTGLVQVVGSGGSATLRTLGNNTVTDNGVDTSGTITSASTM